MRIATAFSFIESFAKRIFGPVYLHFKKSWVTSNYSNQKKSAANGMWRRRNGISQWWM
jgi:hypothetical protein